MKTGLFVATAQGLQITFANGWTASVQIGSGNYCSNRTKPVKKFAEACPNAEVAAWKGDKWHKFENDKETDGWKSPEQVLDFLNEVAAKKK